MRERNRRFNEHTDATKTLPAHQKKQDTVNPTQMTHPLQRMQRTVGNRAVGLLIRDSNRALPAAYRDALALQLGSIVNQVRLHTGKASRLAAQQMGAAAFTIGSHVYLGDRLAKTPLDREESGTTLIHELVHTAQQAHAAPGSPLTARRGPNDPHEREARLVTRSLAWGHLQDRYHRVAADHSPAPGARARRRQPQLSLARTALQLVELTYDDGPDTAGNTRKILEHLKKAGARATFYVVGRRVVEGDNWRVVFDIAASGNWLGNHAFDWNMQKDNHIFLHGSHQERARKLLITEWAIQDALIRGKAEAQAKKTWQSIPQANRDYIDDVIAHGTGRFRTPGFRSKWWRSDDRITRSAIVVTNQILAAAGLRTFDVSDEVSIDPKDWQKGRTSQQIEKSVKEELSDPDDSILLHSRLSISAQASPAIIAEIKKHGWSFDAPARGKLGALLPKPGFAGLKTISNPPTKAEVRQARKFLLDHKHYGWFLMGHVALGIFKMAHLVGKQEVRDFMKELETTPGPKGSGYMVNFLSQLWEFRQMYRFLKVWIDKTPFPRGPGVKY